MLSPTTAQWCAIRMAGGLRARSVFLLQIGPALWLREASRVAMA